MAVSVWRIDFECVKYPGVRVARQGSVTGIQGMAGGLPEGLEDPEWQCAARIVHAWSWNATNDSYEHQIDTCLLENKRSCFLVVVTSCVRCWYCGVRSLSSVPLWATWCLNPLRTSVFAGCPCHISLRVQLSVVRRYSCAEITSCLLSSFYEIKRGRLVAMCSKYPVALVARWGECQGGSQPKM